jgi:hypothetical protein
MKLVSETLIRVSLNCMIGDCIPRSKRITQLLAFVFFLLPVFGQEAEQDDTSPPFDRGARLHWLAAQTVGPRSLALGVVSSGWSTLFDSPREYNTNFSGFGKRYGLRLAGVATSNTMEAGLGALWGEDPRYRRQAGKPFGSRVWSTVRGTFVSRNRAGRPMPAYAFYAAAPGSHFLSNTWRPDSHATVGNALVRTVCSFLNRMAANAFVEFLPDLRERLR